ncbi:MAG: PA14 domain-containing protein, partial [Bacteroidales bacterium]
MKNYLQSIQITIIILLFFLLPSKTALSQNVNLEYFPGELQSILQDAPTSSAMKIFMKDSIESNSNNDSVALTYYTYRFRGYLVPPQNGYYKFYLRSVWGSFYLSLDSMEYHKRLAISTKSIAYPLPPWPTDLSQRYNAFTTYYIDSVYLQLGKPYYFEITQGLAWWAPHNYFGMKWVLPGGDQLQTIKNDKIKPAAPKPLRSDVDYDIFENQSAYNFTDLKEKPFPDQRLNLHSLLADNIPDGLDKFSSRTRGYIIPPYDGTYSFYFASDDAGQFWLSTDTSEANAQLKSNITSAQTDWKQNVSTQALIADQKYFFEVLQHDSIGNHTIKLGWEIAGDTVPEVIGYSNLMGYIDGIPPNRINLAKHKSYSQKNLSFTIQYEIYPWNTINKNVRWKSTDPSIATVNSLGKVSTLNWGECQIIIQSVADTTIADTLVLNVNRIEWEVFKNRMSYNYDSIRTSIKISDEASEIVELNTPNHLSGLDRFVSRIRGYLLPPASGNYSFYFACDNTGQFWLSSDTSTANAQLKSEIFSAQSDWSQHISTQTLSAGQEYYFEILQYDTVYTDMIKLGWNVPGDTVPSVIHTPYMAGSMEGVSVNSISLPDHELIAFTNWTITPRYHITPWNAANRAVNWTSTNTAVAGVNSNGLITTVNPGTCQIIVSVVQEPALSDTLQLTVTNYFGPYFIKQNADIHGDGHSWDNAITITKLLDILNQGTLNQRINVFIAQGNYKPTTTFDRNKTFLLNNIRLVGGFDSGITGIDTTTRDIVNHETILSGEIGIPGQTIDNSYHVIRTRGNVSIDGLTIRDGRANSRIYGEENLYEDAENQGGGIYMETNGYTQTSNVLLTNCRLTNNSAFNSAGGIFGDFIPGSGPRHLTMLDCTIDGNKIQQNNRTDTAMFLIYINGYGAGICFAGETLNLDGCRIFNNQSPNSICNTLVISNSMANIKNTSIYNNTGSFSDVCVRGFGTMNMDNSTLKGRLMLYGVQATGNITNSTIVGGYNPGPEPVYIHLDNSIWNGVTLAQLNAWTGGSSTNLQVKYSIIGDELVGESIPNILLDSIPEYTTWLDTLAYNGGPTPTMKLKNVLNNPAKTNGNLLYLGTTDQRGALRIDSVSIGAYQYDFPHTGIVEVKAFPEGLFNASTHSLTKSRNASG